MNDERPLRRLVRKFHAFSSQAQSTSPEPSDSAQVEEAKRNFLLELATYQMNLRRSALSCQAESRQVTEYQREKERLGGFFRRLLRNHR
jgi:THO complex subunit 7